MVIKMDTTKVIKMDVKMEAISGTLMVIWTAVIRVIKMEIKMVITRVITTEIIMVLILVEIFITFNLR